MADKWLSWQGPQRHVLQRLQVGYLRCDFHSQGVAVRSCQLLTIGKLAQHDLLSDNSHLEDVINSGSCHGQATSIYQFVHPLQQHMGQQEHMPCEPAKFQPSCVTVRSGPDWTSVQCKMAEQELQ